MSRTRFALLALSMSALVGSGCGQSHTVKQSAAQKQSTASAALTRAELIAHADAICKRVNAKRATKVNSRQDVLTDVAAYSSYAKIAYGELRKLNPPATMVTDWERLVAAAQILPAEAAKYVAYTKANDPQIPRNELIKKIGAAETTMVNIARHDGFNDCAKRIA
jgi:hypothetical protein